MKKYFYIIKNTWDEMTTYRLNFTMWRVRNVLQILTMYFLWLAILPSRATLVGYTRVLILTYILGTSLISSIVLSSRSFGVGDEINRGELSSFLLRPINYFYYLFAKDMGDKAMNIVFSIGELSILFLILKPPLFIQTHIFYLLATVITVAMAVIMFFLFNLLLGFIGFWSPETWAPRFIFMILISFFAGGLFPLDILPKGLYILARCLPFTYFLFFPLKVYLGQLQFSEILLGFFISVFWAFAMYYAVKVVWRRGLKIYTASGI